MYGTVVRVTPTYNWDYVTIVVIWFPGTDDKLQDNHCPRGSEEHLCWRPYRVCCRPTSSSGGLFTKNQLERTRWEHWGSALGRTLNNPGWWITFDSRECFLQYSKCCWKCWRCRPLVRWALECHLKTSSFGFEARKLLFSFAQYSLGSPTLSLTTEPGKSLTSLALPKYQKRMLARCTTFKQ